MKFDKETAVVVIVCIILITLCHTFFSPAPAEQAPAAAKTEEPVPAEKKDVPADVKGTPAAEKKADVKKIAVPEKISAPVMKAASIENDKAIFFFDSNGILHEIKSKNIKRTKSNEDIVFKSFPGNEPFTFELDGWKFITGKVIKNSDSQITVEQVFQKGNEQVTAVKVFTVVKDNAVLNCTFRFNGTVQKLDKVTVWGGTIAPLKQFSNDELRDVHQAEYMFAGNGSVKTIEPNTKKPEKYLSKGTDQPVKWVAVSNKYFLSQLYSPKPFNGGTALVSHSENDYPEPGIAGVYRDLPLSTEFNLSLYAGSKAIEQIGKLPVDAQEAIHLAYWSWFEFLCRPMLALLNWLKAISGSYGLAIILLTVIVKLVLWPLIHKGNKSMRRMGKIQPMLKELKEKYKDNPQLFNQKMMELYRQEKVSPMGGCLPMLLQFPVFIALYSTLEAAVELRNVPFLWAKDLSQPDAIGPEIFGYSLHPLILISTGLMVLQMKLSPQTGDPAQRKMMMFMPLIMLIFFYNFPSGLALYWTVNNILSILQMKYSQYAARKEEERETSAGNGSAKAV
ncbi:MAG: membrane protein insertase YidC [Lentisphaeria bacterium]|nr:membrane protein insertase YidC [Lentisphaeria bacterium]